MKSRGSFLFLSLAAFTSSFTPVPVTKSRSPPIASRSVVYASGSSENDGELTETCWNPKLRRTMGTVASLGALETAYLTFDKLTGGGNVEQFCSVSGACGSVLSGPYSVLPGTDIPLAALGFLAYTTTAALALGPVFQNETDDSDNRVQLTALSTAMGVFSVLLMTLLFGVLKESCTFCIASATFSIILAKLAWLGGVVPKDRFKEGLAWSAKGALATLTASVVLFAATDDITPAVNVAGQLAGTSAASFSRLLADASSKLQAPPPITAPSSSRALQLSTSLQTLDARMYGAYWCSHCFEQKQTLGREAMSKIPYIECSQDGLDSQTSLCKAKDLPGYPTWEINGKLFPGEQAIDELEEIVQKVKQ